MELYGGPSEGAIWSFIVAPAWLNSCGWIAMAMTIAGKQFLEASTEKLEEEQHN
jgi:hypothetical protein